MEAMDNGLRSRAAAKAPRQLRMDSLGVTADYYRTESLTATCLLIIALCSLGAMLYVLRCVMIPFLVALVLMYLLQPIVNILTKPPRRWCDKCCRRRGERCCESLSGLTRSRRRDGYERVDGASGRNPAEDFARGLQSPRAREAVLALGRAAVATGAAWEYVLDTAACPRWLAVFIALSFAIGVLTGIGMAIYSSVVSFNWLKYELGAQQLTEQMSKVFAVMDVNVNQDLVPYLVDRVKNLTPYVLQGIVDCFSSGVFVVIFLMYLLSTPVRPPQSGTWGQVDLHIRRYIRLKTAICVAVGFFVGVVLWLLAVDLAFLWALLTFLLNFIPNVGPIVATFLPMPLVVLDPTLSAAAKVAAFILPSVVHMIIGNIMEPRLFGQQLELHPIVVLIALAFWSVLWGVPGMVLSVPLMAVTRIICSDLEHPYARVAVQLMEGHPWGDDDAGAGAGAASPPAKGAGARGSDRPELDLEAPLEETKGPGGARTYGSL